MTVKSITSLKSSQQERQEGTKEYTRLTKKALWICDRLFLLSYCALFVPISVIAGVIGGNSCVESGL